jgi:hypothetical protein
VSSQHSLGHWRCCAPSGRRLLELHNAADAAFAELDLLPKDRERDLNVGVSCSPPGMSTKQKHPLAGDSGFIDIGLKASEALGEIRHPCAKAIVAPKGSKGGTHRTHMPFALTVIERKQRIDVGTGPERRIRATGDCELLTGREHDAQATTASNRRQANITARRPIPLCAKTVVRNATRDTLGKDESGSDLDA